MARSRRFSQFKAFILEPILTPSTIIDTGFDDSSDGLMDEGWETYDLSPTDGDDIELPVEAESVDVVPETMDVEGEVFASDEIEPIAYVDFEGGSGQVDYTAGVFTVDDSGYVSIDYLFDGGKYDQGELAIFSLEGMTQEPGSRAFIQEAARRALSSSELGYVVISDATDGARFSNTGGVDFNTGEYAGVRTFKMNGGDRFGFMLAPNHSIEQVYNGEAWQPIFSMATANPDDHFQFGQIADLTGDGTVFTLEDISLANGRSDRDYDDIVFQLRGATGYAPHVEEVIAEGRNIETRLPWGELIEYVTNPPELDLLAVGDFNVIYSDRFFNPTESFSLIGLVDQVDAVERVEVWVRGFEGDWLRLGDVEDFGAEGHYRFDYGAALNAGHYEVKAIAFYPGGEVETITPVTVLSLDEGVELSGRVRAALTRAVELGSYDPYALAQTTDWVLSVRSGTDLAALATQLGIAEFEPTGILANTYRVSFGSNLSATQVQSLINGINSIEYGTPLVREQVHYHSPTNDPLASNQWYLNQGGIYDAWATHGVSGKGITMGILDDGFAIDHPDLIANYRADLSWDFDERDNDPSPTYEKTLNVFRYHQDQHFPIFDLPQFPNLLNAINFYTLPFSNVSGTVQDLTLNFALEHQGDNPLKLSLHRYDAGGNLSQPAPNTILIPSPSGDGIGTGSYSINLTDQLQGWSAKGLWALSIEDLSPFDGKSGLLKDLSLDIIALNSHGTAVTGVATAVGDNSIGIVGVAPDAQWVGIRAGVEGIDSLTAARALTHNLDQIDLYNNSWGLGLLVNSFLGIHALEQASRTQGTPYIFSGGNNRTEGYNVNYGTFANSPYTIAVGAVDHTGKVADYSAPGAALFISAYSAGSGQGVTTTDVNGGYRDDFGGTSAAAPVVSGVVALLLEANPNLNWRDIQHILAQSADRTAINDPNANWSGSEGDAIRHSHDYGFGLVDPVKAVELAKSWQPLNPLVTIAQGAMVNQMIPDYNQSLGLRPVRSTITVEQDITVESVEVLFNGKHGYLGDLEITLISPSGERSILAQQHQGTDANRRYQNDDDVYFWTFSSFHHWGESSQGEWTLEVVDKRTGNLAGSWTNWEININGLDPNYVAPVPPQLTTIGIFEGAIQGQVYTITYDQLVMASDLVTAEGDDVYFKIQSISDGILTVNGQSVIPGETTIKTSDVVEWIGNQLGDEVVAFAIQAISNNGISENIIDVKIEVLPLPNLTPIKIGNAFQVNQTEDHTFVPRVTTLSNGNFLVSWTSYIPEGGRTKQKVFGRIYDNQGNPIGTEFQINKTDKYAIGANNSHTAPITVALEDGGFISLWNCKEEDGVQWSVYGQKYNNSGQRVGEEFQISPSAIAVYSPSIITLDDGMLFISWSQYNEDSNSWDIYGQKYDSDLSFVGEEIQINTHTKGNQFYVSMSSLKNGSFIVTWTSDSQDGSGWGVYGQIYDGDVNPIGQEFKVNTYTLGNQSRSSTSIAENGVSMIVWNSENQDGSGVGIYGQLYDGQGNSLGNEFLVNTYTLNDQKWPEVMALKNGEFIVTWISVNQGDSAYGVYGQRYSNQGEALGEEFLINTNKLTHTSEAFTADLKNGNFVTVWKSTHEEDANEQHQLFAQIFSINN